MARGLVPIVVLSLAGFCASVPAFAQQAEPRDPSTPTLFDPHFDSGRTQQFRSPGAPARPGEATIPVSNAAGTTGFDATNARVKRKAKETAQKRARAEAENLPPIAATAPDRSVASGVPEPGKLARRSAGVRPIRPRSHSMRPAPSRRVRSASVSTRQIRSVRSGSMADRFSTSPRSRCRAAITAIPVSAWFRKGSTFEKVAPELSIKSDWSRHELSADLKGSYIWYNDNGLDNLNKPDLDLRAKARLDITKQTKAEIEGRFGLHADNPGDPNLPTDIATPPIYITPGATAGSQPHVQSPGIVAQGLDRSYRLWRCRNQ